MTHLPETDNPIWPPPVASPVVAGDLPTQASGAGRLALCLSVSALFLCVACLLLSVMNSVDLRPYIDPWTGRIMAAGVFGLLGSFLLGVIGWRTWQGVAACLLSAAALCCFGYLYYAAGFDYSRL